MPDLSRRSLLLSATALGGSLTLGFAIPVDAASAAATDISPEITAWIVIHPDDTVVIRVARAEMGQGSLTALPMLVAEELECDWSKVRPEQVAPEENFRRDRVWGDMSTGASRSVTASHEYLRRAGATAREMLIAAAAIRWGVSAAECRAAHSIVTHVPTGRTCSFGVIAQAAAAIPPPANVMLKDPKDWKLIGTPQRRFGARDKITGKPIYAIDVRVPDMLYAAIAHCPIFGGTLRAVDQTKVAQRSGVRGVVKLEDAVAVVADSWWQAKQAIELLPKQWDDGGNAALSSADILADMQKALRDGAGEVGREDGDAADALTRATKRVEAEYSVPFLAHATMEPQTCTAHVTPQKVEIWAPTQDAEASLATAAAAAGMPREKVIVHTTVLGGGFGRRGLSQDFVRQAVSIAKEVGRPVQLLWTREEDIRHDFYRPAALARLTAGFDAAGMPLALSVRVAAPSILGSLAPELMLGGFDRQALQGLVEEMHYALPNYRVEYVMHNTPVPVGMWRSVNHSQNAFFKESFVDEMAYAAGEDPYLFRRRLLGHHPKACAVLDAAAERAGWSAPAPPGAGRGIALHEACGSFCAQVLEVSVGTAGELRVHRVVAAIDCGHAVNPRTIAAQTEGAIADGLAAALYGEISIGAGQAEQSNFHDYEMLRMAEMPDVETVIVPSGGFWGGVGEPPLTPLAPALCNAVFAATGKRIRSLPLKNHGLRRT